MKFSMNGCPAWYDLNYIQDINRKFVYPKKIQNIVISTPAEIRNFYQIKSILREVRILFPQSNIHLSLHKGFEDEVPSFNTKFYSSLLDYAKKYNIDYINLGDKNPQTEQLSIYDNCDFHIGYRVHAHIYCLSHFKASFLIAEDSRGIGVLDALGGRGFQSWNRFANLIYQISPLLLRIIFKILRSLKLYWLEAKLFNKTGLVKI